MQPVLSSGAIRAAEQTWFDAHPGGDLMGLAAAAVSERAGALLGGRLGAIVVIAGTGNNAGDGLYAAAELATRGHQVHLWLPLDGTHRAGLAAACQSGALVLEQGLPEALATCDLVIDALFGIGGRPGLPPNVAAIADLIADLDLPVLAVDLPSGLDADSSEPHQCITATHTVTFIAPKPCHVCEPAASACGEVTVVDLGVAIDPAASFAHAWGVSDVARCWPYPGPTSDKYSRGVVGLDTGSSTYPGAALLGVLGALHSGAGMVRFAGSAAAVPAIRTTTPSAVVGTGRVQAWVCGSGWGTAEGSGARLAERLAAGVPCVIDADALAQLPDRLPPNCLLTPHAGELAQLMHVDRARVAAEPVAHARAAARETGATVLLKGATQYAVRPDGHVAIAVPGPAWTAQAGSGDVLAGVAGTLLAAGLEPQVAGVVAASIQALAAASAPGPWPPDEVTRRIPTVVAQLGSHSWTNRG